jgi:2-octaprenylphenol hydroxylase
MNERFDIVIAGGGLAGLTLAALLAQCAESRGLRLTLVDAAPRPVHEPDDDIALRVSAIATGSAALLDGIGAWPFVQAARVCAYDRMRVWDESVPASSRATLRFDAAEFAVPQLGFIVENVLMRHAILDVLDRHDVELIFATAIDSLQYDGERSRLRLDNGRELRADLVIGADGIQSFVRQSVGIETHDWPYGQSAFVTHLRPEKPHRNTAWQRFLEDGPLGMLPLPDGRISVVWSTSESRVAVALEASDDKLGQTLSKASDWVLGELRAPGPRGAFPLCARHAERYVLPGVALIGDAAHSVHPLAGQGANLGLQDAATLAGILQSALANGEHPGDRPVLRRYERARKGANATMLHFMTGLNRLFATDSAVIRQLRTAGMRLFNYSGPIREHVVNVALGARGGRSH